MLRGLISFFIFLVSSLQLTATNFDLLKCDQYTIDDGLPQSFVEKIFQDEKGFLWIATQDGVSKFNGYEFENFFSNPFDTNTIASNYIVSIDNWKNNAIIFTTNYGISIFNTFSKKFKNYDISVGNDNIGIINSSVIVAEDSIIISSSKGIFGINLKNDKLTTAPLWTKGPVRSIIHDNNKLIFAADSNLYGISESVNLLSTFDKRISKIFKTDEGLNLSFQKRLISLDKNYKTKYLFESPSSINDCILIDGKYWLATKSKGVIIYDPKSNDLKHWYLNKNRENLLLSHQIRCIFQDKFGIIWFGSDKGLNKIDPSKQQFLHYRASLNNELSSDNCWSFFENDSIFISGYDNGIEIETKSDKKYHWLSFDGLILDVEEVNDNILLATSKGIYELKNIDSTYFVDTNFIDISINDKPDIIFKIFSYRNKIIVGSNNYLSIYDKNWELENRWRIKGVRDFTVYKKSVYFTASPTGIYQINNLDNPDITNYQKYNLPEVKHLMGLSLASTEENIWLGLYGGGLIKFDPQTKKSKHYSTKNGLPNNTIYSIVRSKNHLWLSTNGGLSKYNLSNDEFLNFNTSDGIQSLEFNSGASYQGINGKIYFGGIKGYNIVNPEKDNRNTTPPEVYISSILYNGEDILNSESEHFMIENNENIVVIPHKKNSFVINVDALHFSSPEENIFKIKLEGWQNEWKVFKGKGTFQFSNLKDGEYYFIVKAANSDGVWSYNERKIKIIIKPPFYLTWWFITGLALIIGSITAYTIYSRLNRSKFQREILERKVRDRTREVENQKKKLEEKNRELEYEKNKEEEVLLNVLPRETAKELVSTGKSTPKSYKMATVMFADFKNFTKITENLGPKELVAELDDSFAKFDDIVGKLNIEKIKTSGDAYMCVGGVPIRNQTNPVDCVLAAFQFQKYMRQKREIREGTGKPQWHLRIGMHTGALVAGVVGKKKFLYDVWGDTVNTAARMETSADAGKINISGTTYEYIKDYFDCEYRGKLPVKNKGAIDMYYVNRIKAGLCKDEEGQTPNRKFFELLNFKVYTQQNFHNVRDYFIDLLEQNEFVSKLKYHGPHHTLDVMEAAERIGRAEGLSEEELMLVKVAALFHDSGFLNKYQNNEPEGAKLAKRELPRYGFTDAQVEIVEGMILATKIPQDPKNHLEEILCDADLDYLGRDREEFEKISSSLAEELIDMKLLKSKEDWDPIQVKFLEAHKYFTKTCVETRRPGKIERLREIKDRLKGPNEE